MQQVAGGDNASGGTEGSGGIKARSCVAWGCGLPIAWVTGWILVFLLTDIGCRSSDQTWTDFSGTYRLAQSNESGSYPRNPFLDIGSVASDSTIVIRHEAGEKLIFTEQTKDGMKLPVTVDLDNSKFYWRSGELHYFHRPKSSGGIFPGVGFQTRSAILKKDESGNLNLSTSGSEKALMLFCIPFMETINKGNIYLKRIDEEAPATGR